MEFKLRIIHLSMVFKFVIAKRQRTGRKLNKQKTFCHGREKNGHLSFYHLN